MGMPEPGGHRDAPRTDAGGYHQGNGLARRVRPVPRPVLCLAPRLAPRLAALLCALAASAAGEPAPPVPEAPGAAEAAVGADRAPGGRRPRPRPAGAEAAGVEAAGVEAGGGRRCTRGGELCIASATYAADVCRAIEAAAAAAALDAGFLARLLWRESLFDADAVSPAGAQGIAQFMPETARIRRLADPFNPAEAILASAVYLEELERRFGNLGLAAAAYNAGEAGAARWLAGSGALPGETRAYVLAITGHPASAWRAAVEGGAPPAPDLALEPGRPFEEACLDRARGRGIPALRPSLLAWGVVVAGRESREAAEREARVLAEGYAALLAGERIDVTRERFPGMRRSRHFAQIGRPTRAGADALCAGLRAAGAGCIVRRN